MKHHLVTWQSEKCRVFCGQENARPQLKEGAFYNNATRNPAYNIRMYESLFFIQCQGIKAMALGKSLTAGAFVNDCWPFINMTMKPWGRKRDPERQWPPPMIWVCHFTAWVKWSTHEAYQCGMIKQISKKEKLTPMFASQRNLQIWITWIRFLLVTVYFTLYNLGTSAT